MDLKIAAITTAALLMGSGAPALALDFGSSSTTGKQVIFYPIRMSAPDDWPVGAELGIRFTPNLSDALGSANLNPQWKDQASWLLDSNLLFKANFKVLDLDLGGFGKLTPIVSPYVGGRYLGAPTWEAPDPLEMAKQGISSISNAGTALSYSQFGGVEYGVKLTAELPLALHLNAGAGLTSLVSGGWDTRRADLASLAKGVLPGTQVSDAGKTNPSGIVLPGINVGMSWTPLPFLEAYCGYEMLRLPTDLRAQKPVLNKNNVTVINNFQIGGRILSLSF